MKNETKLVCCVCNGYDYSKKEGDRCIRSFDNEDCNGIMVASPPPLSVDEAFTEFKEKLREVESLFPGVAHFGLKTFAEKIKAGADYQARQQPDEPFLFECDYLTVPTENKGEFELIHKDDCKHCAKEQQPVREKTLGQIKKFCFEWIKKNDLVETATLGLDHEEVWHLLLDYAQSTKAVETQQPVREKTDTFSGLIEDLKALKQNWIEEAEQNETLDEMIIEGRIDQIQECIDLVNSHANYSQQTIKGKKAVTNCNRCNGTGLVKDEMAGEGCVMDCHCLLYASQ